MNECTSQQRNALRSTISMQTRNEARVGTTRYTNSLRCSNWEKSNGMKSVDCNGHKTGPHVRSNCWISLNYLTSYFVFHIFVINCGSYRYGSLEFLYVLPIRNLVVLSLSLFMGNPANRSSKKGLVFSKCNSYELFELLKLFSQFLNQNSQQIPAFFPMYY